MKYLLFLLITLNSFADISEVLKKEIKNHKLKKDQVGLYIYDVAKDKKVFSYSEGESFYPASVFKILTSYYLLKSLGVDKTFNTRLSYDGDIKDRVLSGNLYLYSEGDPYLLSNDLFDMAYSLKAKGIKEIKGHLYIIHTIHEITRISDVGLDDQAYNQGISSFNVNFNRFKAVRKKSGYISLPQIDHLKVMRSDEKLSPGEMFKRDEDANEETWLYRRTRRSFYEIPIRDTLNVNAEYLIDIIERNGIKIHKDMKVVASEPDDIKTVYTKESLPVSRLIELGMEYSNNLFMEVLLLKATKAKNLDQASLKLGQYLHKNFPDLSFDKVSFHRGSGLTTETQLPLGLVEKFLAKTWAEKFDQKIFITYFSLAGTGGFLARKFLTKNTHERFFAKTGSLDYVNNICGLITGEKEYTFCLYVNNKAKREKLQGENNKKLQSLRRRANEWGARTSRFINKVLYHL